MLSLACAVNILVNDSGGLPIKSEREAATTAFRVLERFDENKDGFLQYGEFVNWWSELRRGKSNRGTGPRAAVTTPISGPKSPRKTGAEVVPSLHRCASVLKPKGEKVKARGSRRGAGRKEKEKSVLNFECAAKLTGIPFEKFAELGRILRHDEAVELGVLETYDPDTMEVVFCSHTWWVRNDGEQADDALGYTTKGDRPDFSEAQGMKANMKHHILVRGIEQLQQRGRSCRSRLPTHTSCCCPHSTLLLPARSLRRTMSPLSCRCYWQALRRGEEATRVVRLVFDPPGRHRREAQGHPQLALLHKVSTMQTRRSLLCVGNAHAA